MPVDSIEDLPFLQGQDAAALRTLSDAVENVTRAAGATLFRQHESADYLYLLRDGKVQFRTCLDGGHDNLPVGSVEQPAAPLGWAGLLAPHRYVVSAVCETDVCCLRWARTELESAFEAFPSLGDAFLRYTLEAATAQLRQALGFAADRPLTLGLPDEPAPAAAAPRLPLAQIMAASLFFQNLPPALLTALQRLARLRRFAAGETLFRQGEAAGGLYVLAAGAVALFFADRTSAASADQDVYYRSRCYAGQVISWSSFSGAAQDYSAAATTDSEVFIIDQSQLDDFLAVCPRFAMALVRRLLWLTSAHLRAARVRLISHALDEECRVVRNLVQQCAPGVRAASPLHKVPTLLDARDTRDLAFRCLDEVEADGNAAERSVARLCLEALRDARKEMQFYAALQRVYDAVVDAPPELPPPAVRRRCAEGFQAAFRHADYAIAGEEHLPPGGGHIFILNHLVSHPYYALANGFELALDTHFVSSMLLYPRYGDGGVRVVRKGRREEWGHQDYYDRLGHIYVLTPESDPETRAAAGSQWEHFAAQAGAHLRAGSNLVVCPEGTSSSSEDSPAAFRSGIFRVAAALDPEPLIVPVAVANFDKRIRHGRIAALVQPAFRMSAELEAGDRTQMHDFLDRLRQVYCRHVAAARELAAGVHTAANVRSVHHLRPAGRPRSVHSTV
jgi:CRP-like cAMP-binding protein/1-acyl-sn-glycerol-3-phosphate acyltransferase